MSVEIVAYDKYKHSNSIVLWMIERSVSVSLIHQFPIHSFVAMDGEEMLAAIGLDMAHSAAFIICLITNPEASSEKRSEAMDRLIENAVQKAKDAGFENILAWTSHESVHARAKTHGFFDAKEVLLVKNLKGD